MCRSSRSFVLIPFVFALAAGCVPAAKTEFHGQPQITGGPAQCMSMCAQWGLDFAGMVAMGEYSTGCVCRARGAAAAADNELFAAVGVGAAAGVRMQMDAQEEADRQEDQRREQERREQEERDKKEREEREERERSLPSTP
jgi:hypothetical protein